MKILIICAGDRSDHAIALSCIKYVHKTNLDEITVCLLDKNKKILKFLKEKKISYVNSKFKKFFDSVKKNEYEWLLNIWGYKILKNKFLKKFKKNLNLHPSYLPYSRGRDPYYFSLINNTPIGICIHEMDSTIDGGKYYIRKKFKKTFPSTAGMVFDKCLREIKNLFIKEWIKIRNEKIKPKIFSPKVFIINKRKTLIKKNFLDLDDKKNLSIKRFVLNCLAQDFKFLKQQIKIYNKIFDVQLKLKNAKKKVWKQ